jgi:dipeptidyl aminopeptidase/acylaminoacyl peptidase
MYPEISLDELYFQPRLLSFAISPENAEVSFVACSDDMYSLYLMTAATVCPKILHQSRSPLLSPKWSHKGDWLAWSDCGINLWSMKKNAHIQMTRQKNHYFLDWAPHGKSLLFVEREEEQDCLWITTLDDSLRSRIQQVKGKILDASWSPDGQQVLLISQPYQQQKITGEIIHVDSEETFLLWEESSPYYLTPCGVWFPDNNHLLITNSSSGYSKLWILDLEKRQQMMFTQDEYDDTAPLISRDGKQVAYTTHKPGSGDWSLVIQQINENQSQLMVKTSGVNAPVAWQRNDSSLFFCHENPQEPNNLWKIELQTGAHTQLTAAGHLGLEKKIAVPRCGFLNQVAKTHYCQSYFPVDFQENKHYPLVIWLPDYPHTPNYAGFAPRFNWLANQGYVVAVLTCRGSTGAGVHFMNDGLKKRMAMSAIEDIRNAVEIFEKASYVQAGKMAIGGVAFGGYLALMALCAYPEMFRCGFAHAAISDWEIQLSQSTEQPYFYALCGRSYAEDTIFFRNISPTHVAKELQTPLLLTHGREDKIVPFAQAQKLADTIAQSLSPVETCFYAGEGHTWQKRENLHDWHTRVARFLRPNLMISGKN